MIKLFNTLKQGGLFHFGDEPGRILVKQDDTHYVGEAGRKMIHPHVAVIPVPPARSKDNPEPGIFNSNVKGDS